MQVLVVEDETRMAGLLRRGLEEEGHSVILAGTGREAISIAGAAHFDAILLDVMLPLGDGFTVTRALRESRNQTPILLLTARDAMEDIVRGLDLGADDYLTQPFSIEILLARLRAISRRGAIPRPARLRAADLTLDPASREITRGERRIPLTRTEFSLLELLMRRAGSVVPRSVMIETVWGFDSDVENNTLDVFMKLLRSKVDGAAGRKLIHTVRGVGYSLREPES